MKIVHVETGMHLYGGPQQVAFLLERLAREGLANVLVCPPGSAIGNHFRGGAVRVVEVPCGGDLDLRFLWRLRRVLRAERPALVHLHSRRGADVLGGLAARWAGVPAVLSRRVDNPEARWWARRKYALYARVIAISQGIADVLAAEGVAPERLRVVRSALDPEPWRRPASGAELRQAFGLPAGAVVAGVVAQLIARKGHAVLLDALARLPAEPAVAVVCFGQGALHASLESAVRARGLSGRVRLAGFRTDLPRWMGALDLLVHPALMEGLGIALLQGAAAGVPVIACRAGGMPEAVQDGVTGVLVPPGDADALAQAIARLASDPALRRRLGDAGRERIGREFSTHAMAQGNLAVYRELVSSA